MSEPITYPEMRSSLKAWADRHPGEWAALLSLIHKLMVAASATEGDATVAGIARFYIWAGRVAWGKEPEDWAKVLEHIDALGASEKRSAA